jgi:hypothetical protein
LDVAKTLPRSIRSATIRVGLKAPDQAHFRSVAEKATTVLARGGYYTEGVPAAVRSAFHTQQDKHEFGEVVVLYQGEGAFRLERRGPEGVFEQLFNGEGKLLASGRRPWSWNPDPVTPPHYRYGNQVIQMQPEAFANVRHFYVMNGFQHVDVDNGNRLRPEEPGFATPPTRAQVKELRRTVPEATAENTMRWKEHFIVDHGSRVAIYTDMGELLISHQKVPTEWTAAAR